MKRIGMIVLVYLTIVLLAPNLIWKDIGDGQSIDNLLERTGRAMGDCQFEWNDRVCPSTTANFVGMADLIRSGVFSGNKDRRMDVLNTANHNQKRRREFTAIVAFPIRAIVGAVSGS